MAGQLGDSGYLLAEAPGFGRGGQGGREAARSSLRALPACAGASARVRGGALTERNLTPYV